MLYDYLLTHYKPNEPIFIEDITLPISPKVKISLRYWQNKNI